MWAAETNTDEYLGGGLYFDTGIGDGSRLSMLLYGSHSAPNEEPVNLGSGTEISIRVGAPRLTA
jgi:hypothetical protein